MADKAPDASSPSKSLLFDVPRALLRHTLSFLALGDLLGANAASAALANEVNSHLAAATAIHSGVCDCDDLFAPGVGSRVIAKLARHARALVSIHLDDRVRWSSAARLQIAPLIRQCAATLAVARFPPNFYTLDVQCALSTCPRLREVHISPFHVLEMHAMTDIVVALVSGCPEIDTVVLQGRHSQAERFARIPRELLTRLSPGRVTTISLNALCEGHGALLARFTATTNLTIEHFDNHTEADMEAFQDALLRMTSLAKLAMGTFEYAGFADPARPLVFPPSLTALELEHVGSVHDKESVRFEAPGLLEFASRRSYSDAGLALVVRGAPRLQSIRCARIESDNFEWLELVDAMCARSQSDAKSQLRVFAVDRCIDQLQALSVRTRIFRAELLIAVLAACPNLQVLDLPLYTAMSPTELRSLVKEIRPSHTKREAPSGTPLPEIGTSKLRQLHLGTCSLAFLQTLALSGQTLHVTKISVDELQTSYSMDSSDPIDLMDVLEAFPAADCCSLRLGYALTRLGPWRERITPSRVTRLSITMARGDFSGMVLALIKWCPLLRELTLVGPDLDPCILDLLADDPSRFARLSVLRFCGRGKYVANDPFAALRAARPHLLLSRCIHGYQPDTDELVCKWW